MGAETTEPTVDLHFYLHLESIDIYISDIQKTTNVTLDRLDNT